MKHICECVTGSVDPFHITSSVILTLVFLTFNYNFTINYRPAFRNFSYTHTCLKWWIIFFTCCSFISETVAFSHYYTIFLTHLRKSKLSSNSSRILIPKHNLLVLLLLYLQVSSFISNKVNLHILLKSLRVRKDLVVATAAYHYPHHLYLYDHFADWQNYHLPVAPEFPLYDSTESPNRVKFDQAYHLSIYHRLPST